MNRGEIILEVTEAPEGGYDARALGHGVFTRCEDWDDLKEMVRDAVRRHFGDDDVPGVIRLHFVRDEAIADWGCRGSSRRPSPPSVSAASMPTELPTRREAT